MNFDFKPKKGTFLASNNSFWSQIPDRRATTFFEIEVYEGRRTKETPNAKLKHGETPTKKRVKTMEL